MKKPIVFMFSGQGAQYYGMGKELYDNHPRFKLWMDHCDEIVQPLIGTSLVHVLYQENRKSESFDRILYTNPALVCIGYSLARVLMEMGLEPDFLLGYSLGEITAAVVSGAVSLQDAIQLTVDYAQLLEDKSPPAAMLAVIESDAIITQYPDLFQFCWVTGKNFTNNFVVSGLSANIQRLQSDLRDRNILSQKLPVNYGFHTQLMDPLKQDLQQISQRIHFGPVKLATFSSLTSDIVDRIDEHYLWNLLRYPVDFQKTIKVMLKMGDYQFIDVGPSGTLATFVKYLLPLDSGSSYSEVMNPFGKDMHGINKLNAGMNIGTPAAMQTC